MTAPKPARGQATELTTHFKACVPFLRIDTLQRVIDLVLAMITAQSVNHRDLGPHLSGTSSPEAKKRRVLRAVHDEQLTAQVFLALVLVHLPPGKTLMSLDRTTWEHGDAPLNLLVLGAVVHGYTIPLVWVALDHTGNSDTRARMWVVLKLLQTLPAHRWKGLVADREVTLAEWFRFLRRQGIRRAVRIRKNTVLDELPAGQWFDDLQPGQFSVISEATWVFGERMRVVATRSPMGDLVIIATDFGVWETWNLYKLRWSVEFPFRDGKQFSGLSECQSRKVEALHFHWNMALMAVSAARLSQLRNQRAGSLVFSMEDEKRRAYNEFFAARILSILTQEQTEQKCEDLLADLLLLGVKAA